MSVVDCHGDVTCSTGSTVAEAAASGQRADEGREGDQQAHPESSDAIEHREQCDRRQQRERHRRHPHGGGGDVRFAIGGPRAAPYEPSAWEDFFVAERHRAAGDLDAYLAELTRALERRPDHPAALYHVARAEALAGRPDEAIAHLRRAVEARPGLGEHARAEDDFAALRERPDWPVAS